MKKSLFYLVATLGFLGLEIAHADNASMIQAALDSVGVVCGVNGFGNIEGYIPVDNRPVTVIVDSNVFNKNMAFFRFVRGGATRRPKISDLTDEQLEWILIENGQKKAGGIRILDNEDNSSTLVIRVPVPDSAGENTLKDSMWLCASIVAEVEEYVPQTNISKIPGQKVDDALSTISSHLSSLPERQNAKQSFQEERRRIEVSAPSDIRRIFEKAREEEARGNISFQGFYIGMNVTDYRDLLRFHGFTGFSDIFSMASTELDGREPQIYQLRVHIETLRKICGEPRSFSELVHVVEQHLAGINLQKRTTDEGGFCYEGSTPKGVHVTLAEETTRYRASGKVIYQGLVLEDATGEIQNRSRNFIRRAGQERQSLFAESVPQAAGEAAETIIQNMVQIPSQNFWMGKYEVTRGEWEAIMGMKYPEPINGNLIVFGLDGLKSLRENNERKLGPSDPVQNILYWDALVFIDTLNSIPIVRNSGFVFRLPTKEEWCFACRGGGEHHKLQTGQEVTRWTLDDAVWYERKGLHPVGEKVPNKYGLYDMLGNVEEWTCTEGYEENAYCCCGYDYLTDPDTYASYLSKSSGFIGPSRTHDADTHRGATGFRLCADKR